MCQNSQSQICLNSVNLICKITSPEIKVARISNFAGGGELSAKIWRSNFGKSNLQNHVLGDKSLRSEEFPTQVRGELSARIGGGELSAIFPFRKSLRTDFTFWTLCSDFNQLFKCLIQEFFYLHILSCVWYWTRLLA